jgi:hypothetical protein
VGQTYKTLDEACADYKRVPAALRQELSAEILQYLQQLESAGALKKWGSASAEVPERRSISMGAPAAAVAAEAAVTCSPPPPAAAARLPRGSEIWLTLSHPICAPQATCA